MWELSEFDGGGDKDPVLYIAPIRYEYQLPEDGLPFVRPYAAEEMGKLLVTWFKLLPEQERENVRFVGRSEGWPRKEDAEFRHAVENNKLDSLTERFFAEGGQEEIIWLNADGETYSSLWLGLNPSMRFLGDPWDIEMSLSGNPLFDELIGAGCRLMAAYTGRHRAFADAWPSLVPGEALLKKAETTSRSLLRPQLIGPGFPGRLPRRMFARFIRALILSENGERSLGECVSTVLEYAEKTKRIRWIVTEKLERSEQQGELICQTKKWEDYYLRSLFLEIAQKRIEDFAEIPKKFDAEDIALFRACRIPFGGMKKLRDCDVDLLSTDLSFLLKTDC